MTDIDSFINDLGDLPPAPMVLGQLLPLLSNPNSCPSDVVDLITYDPGMTAKVLKMSNSAFFGGGTPADTLDEAVARLGFKQLFDLVSIAVSQGTLAGTQDEYGIDDGELWRHSVVAAVASRVLASYAGIDEGVAFTAALLHDMGKTVLSKKLSDKYDQVITELEEHNKPWDAVERDIVGADHAEVGAAILKKWEFPETIYAPVKYHHCPSEANGSTPMASTVHIGNIVAYQLGHGFGLDAFAMKGDPNAFNNIGVSREKLPELLIDTQDELTKVEPMLKTKFR